MMDKPGCIVEIVGLAGAGKTTLFHLLSRHNQSIYPSNFPDVRRLSNTPFFIWNGLQTSLALLNFPKHPTERLNRQEFAWLSILRGWPDVLHNELKDHKIIILDQGPVYLMTETCEFGPRYLKEKEAETFWQSLYSRWADTLDMIVWLDAADTDLLERIRSREKRHILKNGSEDAANEFFARYRRGFKYTISGLTNNRKDLKVLRFNTSQESPEDIVNQLLIEFGSA